jgi:hypothetical protein
MAAPARTPSVSDHFVPLTPGVTGMNVSTASGRTSRDQRLTRLAGLATIVALTVLLLLPALFNGYPILFPDTADYLLRSQTLIPSPLRALGYALWLRLAGGGTSLWLPVIAQSLLLAALVWRTVRIFGRPRLGAALGAALIMVVVTSIGWVSSKAMPDVFVATVILGVYLTACHWTALGIGGRALAIAAVAIGATMHLTNALVGAAALGAILVLRWEDRADRAARRAWVGAALLLVAATIGTRVYENVRREDAKLPFNGSVFVLSHLVETGLAQQLLQERCATEQFALCPVRDTLTRDAEMFVWRPENSPRWFVLHDDPALIREETTHILGGIVRHHPLALASSIVGYTARQLFSFRVNDEIWRHRNRTEVHRVIGLMYPSQLPVQERARQQENTLRLPWTPLVHLIAFLAAAAISLVLLRRERLAHRIQAANAAGFHVIVWVTLLANAAICANLASVFSRYQSRVSWLLPFAVVISLLERSQSTLRASESRTTHA